MSVASSKMTDRIQAICPRVTKHLGCDGRVREWTPSEPASSPAHIRGREALSGRAVIFPPTLVNPEETLWVKTRSDRSPALIEIASRFSSH